jgi:hypothetical protein
MASTPDPDVTNNWRAPSKAVGRALRHQRRAGAFQAPSHDFVHGELAGVARLHGDPRTPNHPRQLTARAE